MPLKSAIPGLAWPSIVTGEDAALLALAFQMEQSQWWSSEEIEAHQHRQLAALLRHAHATVPWYRERLRAAGCTGDEAITPERWRRIPLLTKQDIRHHQAELRSRRVPLGHGATFRNKTSGSTGEPLEVLSTEITRLFWDATALRDDLWHRRDLRGRLVAIRSGRYAPDPLAVQEMPGWGILSPSACASGPVTILYHLMPIAQQAELLEAKRPHYILMYPSNARALCRHARRRPVRLPDLEAVHTLGEPLTPDVRAACRETWGVPVRDSYSCEEMGFIALECPLHEHYHVQSESVLVEILDEEGQPARPGQIGTVVLTALHDFAMPLIRYAIGDYAEVGEPCPCGRGLPVLKRIWGRRRNQVTLPDGRRAWPDVGALWAAMPDAEQIQVLQRGPDHVEVRFAGGDPLSPAEEQAIGARIQEALGHPFRLTFTGPQAIPRQPNGKYETFVDAR
jgi:phenylacetate-CoA ligase